MTTNSPNPVDGDVQALIGLCKIEIKRWKAASEANPNMRYMVTLMETALASLIAEPEYNTSDEGGEIFLEVSKAEYDKCHEDYRWISYPAPPAQLLRLPEKADRNHPNFYGTSDDFCAGWNHHDAEVQRLNATTQPVSDGWVLVPRSLTAENGAKAALLGEFSLQQNIVCHDCLGEGCDDCSGQGHWISSIPVDWTTIKEIWAKGVEHFSPAAPGGK